MVKNNGSSWVREETMEKAVLEATEALETLRAIKAGIRLKRAQSALGGRNIGYLLIGGKPLSEIEPVPSHSIWSEPIGLDVHTPTKTGTRYGNTLRKKRPLFARFLEQYTAIGLQLWETGSLNDAFDVDTFIAQAQEALAADQSEAVLDNCIWATMDWKWQTWHSLCSYPLNPSMSLPSLISNYA